MIIAIDGPAGTGKSTIAGAIAKKNNFFNLNSGSFYRALTLKVQKLGIEKENTKAIINAAKKAQLNIKNGRLYLDGDDIEDALHTDEVDAFVADLSTIVPVRHIVNENICRICTTLNTVAEGRDMTTVVFPHAEIKIYLDADVDSRAQRRYDQNISSLSLEEIKKAINERDNIDKNKTEGALIIAKDAFYLDTSRLTPEQVLVKIEDEIKQRLQLQEKGSAMSEKDDRFENINDADMQEAYLDTMKNVEEGGLVTGIIVEVDKEHAYIDIGYKSEGKIPLEEFDETPKIGDSTNVYLISKEGKNGDILISKRRADAKKNLGAVKEAFDNNLPIKGKVVSVVKGGFEVDLGSGIKAFCPISQMDTVRIETPEEYLKKEFEFLIEKLQQGRKMNIVVSRKKFLDINKRKMKEEFFATKQPGDIVEGIVKSFTSFGAFIDLSGFDGLLHNNDISWSHVKSPKDYLNKGDKIELRIVQMNKETMKINLSRKDLIDNPWDTFEERFHFEDIVEGKVTKLADFGAFIELEDGIEGLAHISELSWVKKIKHPSEVLSIGDKIQIMILNYNLDDRRISLGVKQVLPNPWDDMADKFPAGKRGKGKITGFIKSGLFIELEDGIDGFLHIEDISWTEKYKSPEDVYKMDQEVEYIVVDCNKRDRRIKLGVKQLEADPWRSFSDKYSKLSTVEGKITEINDNGLVVLVEENIEGFIHKRSLEAESGEEAEGILRGYNVGDSVKAAIVELNPGKKKLALSIKEMNKLQERKEISQYMDNEDSDEKLTLGDFVK